MCEVNILSQFTHPNLPYLFGIGIDEPQSIITSFHGVNDQPVTLHGVLSEINIDWHDLLMKNSELEDKIEGFWNYFKHEAAPVIHEHGHSDLQEKITKCRNSAIGVTVHMLAVHDKYVGT